MDKNPSTAGTSGEKRSKSSRQRGKKRAHEETKPQPRREAAEVDDSSSDEEDDDLLKTAACWASKEISKSSGVDEVEDSKTQQYSVHITQLSFKATQFDIRQLFGSHGCAIASLRLVYDRSVDEQKRQFRGVAFLDCEDEASFQAALKLNKTQLCGRKINVRPTRSSEELKDIVKTTKELVAEKIRAQKKKSSSTKKAMPERPDKSAAEGGGSGNKRRKKDTNHGDDDGKKAAAKNNHPDRKLTKKERNRRAAVILSQQRKKKKG